MKLQAPGFKPRFARWMLGFAAWGALGFCWLKFGTAPPAQAQLTGSLFSDDFGFKEFYTNKTTQVRMRLSGKRAQPSGQGRYLIKQLRLETFHEDGQREITIEAPECLYDFTARTANSPGPLKILMGEGRMTVDGEGFLWQQAQASLIISNRVRTLVREFPNPKAKP